MNETMTTIVGNVITDLRQRCVGEEGTRVVNFRVASNERRFDRATEKWVDGERLFVSVTCWRRLARGVSASLVKGDPVVVTGRIYSREYEYEGQKRSVLELDAYAVGPDLSRCSAELDRARREGTADPGDHGEPVPDMEVATTDLAGAAVASSTTSPGLQAVPAAAS